jgi:hypothetical protein
VLLFPGSLLSIFLLDRLGIEFGYFPILSVTLVVNIASWYALSLTIDRFWRSKSA